MATSGWVLAIGGVAVGQALALGVGFVQRRWTTTDERRSRVEGRGDDAAKTLLVLLDEVRDLYSGLGDDQAYDVPETARYDLCHRLDREVLQLPDTLLRDRLGELTLALGDAKAVAELNGDRLQKISFILYRAGQELVGAFLRREDLPTPESSKYLRTLVEYARAAEEHNAMMAEAWEQDRKRREERQAES